MTDSITSGSTLTFAAADAADKRRAFRAASRHTARVRLLRRTLLGGGLALIVGTVVLSFYNPLRTTVAGVKVDSVDLDGTKVTMSHPRLSGYRNDGRPYEITASAAVQDIKQPTRFDLHDMDARLTMQDKTVTHVTAKFGTYDSQHDLMNLTSEVLISSDGGLDVRASDAHVEFKSGSVATSNPVSVAMRGNSITADGMRMIDNGAQVTFEGNVHTIFQPGEAKKPDGSQAPIP